MSDRATLTRTGAHRTREPRRAGRSAARGDGRADLQKLAMPEIRRVRMVPAASSAMR
jgi:hypothetical protein